MAWKNLPKAGSKSGLRHFGPRYSDAPSASKSKLTLTQALEVQAAKKHGHGESFWDRVKSGGGHVLHPIEWTFDKILRPAYGVAEAVREDNAWQRMHGVHNLPSVKELGVLGHGFKEGFTGHKKTAFGQVFAEKHPAFAKRHKIVSGAVGFGFDVGLDPVTYLTGGTTFLARSGEHAAAIAAGRRAISDAAGKVIAKSPGHLGEAIAKTTADTATLAKHGKNYRYRHALSDMQLQELQAAKSDAELPAEFGVRKRIISEAARAEEKRVEKAVPHYALGGKKVVPSILGKTEVVAGKRIATGRQLVPALPKLDNLIAREGIGSTTARRFREAFVRASTETPETHAMNITTKHVAERITHEQFRHATLALKDASKGLSASRQRDILHLFEKPEDGFRAIVKRADGVHEVNSDYVKHLVDSGRLTKHEADFASRYQSVMEQMFHNEKAFGASTEHFSEGSGRMYVPHLMDREGNALNDQMRTLMTKAGFERARSDREFSLKQLVGFSESGKLPRGVVADPYELMVSRIRASARRQAELGQLDAMATVGGVRTRLVNTAALDKIRNTKEDLQAATLFKAHEHTYEASKAIRAHEDNIAAAEAKVRQIKFGKKSRTKAAQLAKAEKRIETLKNRGPFLAGAGERFNELQGLNKELRAIDKQEKQVLKGKKNPEYRTDMHTTAALKDEFGHPIALPDELGQAAQKVRRVIDGDDAAIKGFASVYRKMLSRWKVLVTSINPGYRMRNSQTDLWNWWLKPGANPVTMAANLGKATKFLITMKNIEKRIAKEGLTPEVTQALRDFKDMYDHGILSGLYQGDVQTAAEMLRLGHSKLALLKRARLIKFGEKAAQDMNRSGENWVRIAHFFWARDEKGMSAADAAFSVKSAHFDYEDLTPFEQKKMKSIAPFYTWTRKNVPYQIKALFQSPGRYAAFPQAAMEAENTAGNQKGKLIPDYISNSWGIPVGGGNYLLPQLGVSDLQAFDSPKGARDKATSLLSPAIKLPIEMTLNKSFFTGAPIASDTHPRTAVAPLGAKLLSMLPYSNVGTTSRIGPGGKHLYGPGANPYMVYALGQLGPTGNIALKKSGGIGAAQTPVSPLWSYLGGVSIQHVDQAQEKMMEQIQLSNEAKKMLQNFRDEGIIPQSKHKRGRKGRRVESLVNTELGRR